MLLIHRLLNLFPAPFFCARKMLPSARETPCPLPSSNASKSFWLSEPELIGHRTTESLPLEADVVVVGTGITGASALRYLVESGKKLNIVALEAREVCWGATGRVRSSYHSKLFSSKISLGKKFDLCRIRHGFTNVHIKSFYFRAESVPCSAARKASSLVSFLPSSDQVLFPDGNIKLQLS